MDLNDIRHLEPWEWPEETDEMLLETIRDSARPLSERIEATAFAGDLTVMDDHAANVLLSVIRDPAEAPELRARAAIALGASLEMAEIDGFDEDGHTEPPFSRETFHDMQQTLEAVCRDEGAPKEVRRRALEASVRASQDWHADAIRAAFANSDEEWKLTAVFCMRYLPGFDKEIVSMLESRNPDIHVEAVLAAQRGVKAAWPHVKTLLTSKNTDRALLFAAIEAAPGINPEEAGPVLAELSMSRDEEIAEAATDAMMIAEGAYDSDFEAEDEEEDEP